LKERPALERGEGIEGKEELMKSLITGGAGFIGSHLSEALLSQGHKINVVDDLSTGSLENIQAVHEVTAERSEHLQDEPDFSFVKGDILD